MPSVNIATSLFCSPYPTRMQALNTAIAVTNRRMQECPNLTVISLNFPQDVVPYSGNIEVRKTLTRNPVKLFKTDRRLPMVRDVIEHSFQSGADIIGIMNGDLLMPASFVQQISEMREDCAILRRQDIEDCTVDQFETGNIIVTDPAYKGIDGFLFKSKWWKQNEACFPRDLIMAENKWDVCYADVLKKIKASCLRITDLMHVRHSQEWDQYTTGGRHNNRIHGQVVSLLERNRSRDIRDFEYKYAN